MVVYDFSIKVVRYIALWWRMYRVGNYNELESPVHYKYLYQTDVLMWGNLNLSGLECFK